jgi:uncharacterized Zn-finger protein
MEKFPEQKNEIQTKNKISIDYMREITGNKNISEHRLKLLCQMVEQKIDHRTLLQLKTNVFEKSQGE